MTTLQTHEIRPSPVPRRYEPAVRAPAAGVAGIDLDYAPASFFGFVGDHAEESSPPGVVDGPVQTGFGRSSIGLKGPCPIRTGLGPPDHVGRQELLVDDQVVSFT